MGDGVNQACVGKNRVAGGRRVRWSKGTSMRERGHLLASGNMTNAELRGAGGEGDRVHDEASALIAVVCW